MKSFGMLLMSRKQIIVMSVYQRRTVFFLFVQVFEQMDNFSDAPCFT